MNYKKIPIYLIQPNDCFSYENKINYWLPYSVGAIWSYASQFEIIKNHFYVEKLIFKRENVETFIKKVKPNSIFAFSNYIWNFEYNKFLAESIKKNCPNSLIIFGGPQVTSRPIENQFFKKHPYVDTVINGEGEVSFTKCLEDYLEKKLKNFIKPIE